MSDITETEALVMPILCELDAYPKISLHYGVPLLFYGLDRGEQGFTVTDMQRDLHYDRSSAKGAVQAVSKPEHGCFIVRDYTTTLPTLYTATERLENVGSAYNVFTTAIMAKVLLGNDEYDDRRIIRSRAIRHYAFGYSRPPRTIDDDTILDEAESNNHGHRESIMYRALSSLAVRSCLDRHTEFTIKRRVRRERQRT